MSNSDADIVTLLRLAALNEEIRENDFTGDDDTFNDVVQEFSQMVYTHPERLNRNKKKTLRDLRHYYIIVPPRDGDRKRI